MWLAAIVCLVVAAAIGCGKSSIEVKKIGASRQQDDSQEEGIDETDKVDAAVGTVNLKLISDANLIDDIYYINQNILKFKAEPSKAINGLPVTLNIYSSLDCSGTEVSSVEGPGEFEISNFFKGAGANNISWSIEGGKKCQSLQLFFDNSPPMFDSESLQVAKFSASLSSAPNINLDPAVDSHAGILHYEIGVGTEKAKYDMKPLSNLEFASPLVVSGLSLENTKSYFADIIAVDKAFNRSLPLHFSWQVDTTGPILNAVDYISAVDISGTTYTNKTSEGVSFDFEGDAFEHAVFVGEGCQSDFIWERMEANSFVNVQLQNQVNAYSAKLRDALGNESGCVDFFITHDSIGPDALSSFAAQPAGYALPGKIQIDYARASVNDSLEKIEIIRTAGANAATDCEQAGEKIEIAAPFSGQYLDNVPLVLGQHYSYKVCLYDAIGNLTDASNLKAEDISFSNPAPSCLYPPCDAIHSSIASNGTFSRSELTGFAAANGGDIDLADLNGDGDLDVIVGASNAENFYVLGDGSGSFGSPVNFSSRTLDTAVVLCGDFNNDTFIDVLFVNRGTGHYLHLNDGAGGFDDGTIADSTFRDGWHASEGDLNNDGNLDFITIMYDGDDHIYLGDGSGGFSYLNSFGIDAANDFSCPQCSAIADVNSDGNQDIIVGYNSGSSTLSVYLGDGAGAFSTRHDIDSGTRTIALRVADINGDGYLDIVTGKSLSGGIFVTLGDGTGDFPTLTALTVSSTNRVVGLGVADMDGDGNVDIVFSQDSSAIVGFLPGNGDGSFGTQQNVTANLYTTSNLIVGDINNDSILDFVIGEATHSQVFIGQPE